MFPTPFPSKGSHNSRSGNSRERTSLTLLATHLIPGIDHHWMRVRWPNPTPTLAKCPFPLFQTLRDQQNCSCCTFQEVAGRVLCQITGGTNKTHSRAWGYLYLLAEPLLSLYLIYKNKPRNLSTPRGRKHHLHSTIQHNITILSDTGMLSFLLQPPG